MSTYYESAEDVVISRKRAIRELAKHGLILCLAVNAEFFTDCGDHQEYNAQTVLNWLGY